MCGNIPQCYFLQKLVRHSVSIPASSLVFLCRSLLIHMNLRVHWKGPHFFPVIPSPLGNLRSPMYRNDHRRLQPDCSWETMCPLQESLPFQQLLYCLDKNHTFHRIPFAVPWTRGLRQMLHGGTCLFFERIQPV